MLTYVYFHLPITIAATYGCNLENLFLKKKFPQNKLNELNCRSADGTSVPMTVDFIRCKSYENTDSGDEVRITGAENLEQSLRGKVVLLAEDIIDTGKSMMVRTILHELNCKLVGDLF